MDPYYAITGSCSSVIGYSSRSSSEEVKEMRERVARMEAQLKAYEAEKKT